MRERDREKGGGDDLAFQRLQNVKKAHMVQEKKL